MTSGLTKDHLRDQVRTAAEEITALLEKLETTKAGKRACEEKLNQMAPLECEVCGRGLWEDDNPHIHFGGPKFKTKFTAKKVPRKG